MPTGRDLLIENSPHFSSANGRPRTRTVVDLITTPPPLVDLVWIGGAFTPREQHSPESAAAIRVSDDLIAEITMLDRLT